jgi:hypothetical protein
LKEKVPKAVWEKKGWKVRGEVFETAGLGSFEVSKKNSM